MNSESLRRIVIEIEYRRARRSHWARERPRLVVVHGYHLPRTDCLAGESLEGAQLSFPDKVIPVHLSLPGIMVCDCMVRHHHTPLSIARIERILKNSPFYRRLGSNSFERIGHMPIFTPVALRVYVTRLREQIGKALRKGGSMLSPDEALVSESTDSNIVLHSIALPVKVVHRTMKPMWSRKTN